MGHFRHVHGQRAQHDSSGGRWIPQLELLNCIRSVLNVALRGASFLRAHGPLLSFLVSPPFPVGRGLLDTSWGEGESLVGNCSSASVRSQPCFRAHWALPRPTDNRQRQQGCAQGGELLVSAPLIQQGWILPSLPGAGQSWLSRAKDCCWASWILHLLEKPC